MVELLSPKALWLLAAYLCAVAGFGWLALAMEPHWRQVRAGPPPDVAATRTLRVLGGLGLLLSLWACLRADHVTMAALVWVMTLSAAAFTVSALLSWRPVLLGLLCRWIRAPATRHREDPLS